VQREKAQSDGPAAKRRKGLGGIIVESALTAALFTGAAGLVAYALWSGWNARRNSDRRKTESQRSSNPRRAPPGNQRNCMPPPNNGQRSASTSAPYSGHGYVSSRRHKASMKSHQAFQAYVSEAAALQGDHQREIEAIHRHWQRQPSLNNATITTKRCFSE
jgi:hypothetical protein